MLRRVNGAPFSRGSTLAEARYQWYAPSILFYVWICCTSEPLWPHKPKAAVWIRGTFHWVIAASTSPKPGVPGFLSTALCLLSWWMLCSSRLGPGPPYLCVPILMAQIDRRQRFAGYTKPSLGGSPPSAEAPHSYKLNSVALLCPLTGQRSQDWPSPVLLPCALFLLDPALPTWLWKVMVVSTNELCLWFGQTR